MKQPFLNEITVKYKRKDLGTPVINSSRVAAEVAREIFELSQCMMDLKEYFFIMLLNHRNQLTGFYRVSEGTITGTLGGSENYLLHCFKMPCTIILPVIWNLLIPTGS